MSADAGRSNSFFSSVLSSPFFAERTEKSFFSSVIGSNHGLLNDLSSRLEAALNRNLEEERGKRSQSAPQSRRPSVPHLTAERTCARRAKDRSVYGQPEVEATSRKYYRESSQESLDTVDSGNSYGNSSSYSEQRDDSFLFLPTSLGSESCGTTSVDDSDAESMTVDESPSSPSDDEQRSDSQFMTRYVRILFHRSSQLSFEDKARFGEMCQDAVGRLSFARCVNLQRSVSQSVSETSFFALVQHFAIALFECAEADDFTPAKTLMNMAFTFYLQSYKKSVSTREYLYVHLKDQPIWRSVRFWNAAFFDAVQAERIHRSLPTRDETGRYKAEDLRDDSNFQENIFFGQLGTFTYNMFAFGLSKEFALEFLRKQCSIANLSREHVLLLRENMDRLYGGNSS